MMVPLLLIVWRTAGSSNSVWLHPDLNDVCSVTFRLDLYSDRISLIFLVPLVARCSDPNNFFIFLRSHMKRLVKETSQGVFYSGSNDWQRAWADDDERRGKEDTVDNRKGGGLRGYFRLNQGFQLMFNALLGRHFTSCTSQRSQTDTRHYSWAYGMCKMSPTANRNGPSREPIKDWDQRPGIIIVSDG